MTKNYPYKIGEKMNVHNILVFLWGTLFGYLWANYIVAKFLYKIGYGSFREIEPKNKDLK